MTMQKTYNRRRRYLLSRSIRRNPWTNRGYRKENVLKNVLAITRKMLGRPDKSSGSYEAMIIAGPVKSIEFIPTGSGPYKSDPITNELHKEMLFPQELAERDLVPPHSAEQSKEE